MKFKKSFCLEPIIYCQKSICLHSKPLNGLVYDYVGDWSRIEFGFLKNGYQDGVWNFFHENGQASMENIYINGEFIETTKRWDVNGALIEQSYDAHINN